MLQIIAISGLDGSGKTTQIKMLEDYLKNRGKRVFYFHAITFSLANKLASFLSFNKEDGVKMQRSLTKANLFSVFLRKITLRIDIARFRHLLRRLKRKKYDYLLSDRYYFDTLVNLAYLQKSNHLSWLESYYRKYKFPEPTYAFYLNIAPDLIFTREKTLDQPKDYFTLKKKLYEKAAELWKMQTINAELTKEDVFRQICGKISF